MLQRLIFSFIVFASAQCIAADFDSASDAYQQQNYQLAFEQFSELAEAGDARAQTVLAIMYKYGESVPVDMPQSFDWYMKAAIQGYPPAQFNVGVMLADGVGVAKHTDDALIWLQKAADAGYERARDKIAEVTGDAEFSLPQDEPVAWSKSWNLRLPNDIRFEPSDALDSEHKVYRIQLGAMRNLDGAQALWQQYYVGNEYLFDPHQPIFREGQSGGRTIIRVQIGNFDDHRDATAFCEQISSVTDINCLVILTH